MRLPRALKSVIRIRRFRLISAVMRATSRMKWEPLDGISVYNGGDYFHFVTYGLSELYEKQNGNPERSGYRV